jgi:protein phosphatase
VNDGAQVVTNQEVIPQPTFPKVEVAVASDQGRREENQDWLSWTQTPRGELFVIADGMGGYKGGALAAKMTVDTVEASVSDAPPEWSFGKAVTEALSEANREVHRLAHSGNPDTENMGSTALVVLLSDGRAHVAHVGDSRAYLLRNNKLQLLTRDHTRVQQMVDAKMLTPEQARNHPEGHLLSRAIGSRAEVEVEISGPVPLEVGDALLLCSDGLSGFVTDDQICKALNKHRDVQLVPQELVNLALSAGGSDNITIQFVRVDGTVRKRVTAKIPISEVIAQGRTGDAFATLAKRGLIGFVAIAAVLVLAVSTMAALAPPSVTLAYDPATEVLTWTAQQADAVNIQPGLGQKEKEGQLRVPKGTTAATYTATATAKLLMVWTVTSPPVEFLVPAAAPRPGTPAPAPTTASTQPVAPTAPPATTQPPPKVAKPTAKPAAPANKGKSGGTSAGRGNAGPSRPPSAKKSINEPGTTAPSPPGGPPAQEPSPAQQPPPTNQPPTEEPAPANEQAQTSPSQRPAPDGAEPPRQEQEPAVNTPPGQPDEPRR